MADNQNSQTAGPGGPVLLQDAHLIDKLARFDRERIPERVVHAKGSGASGYFEVTADATKWTKAKFLSTKGKRTEVFVRFSTVAGEKGSADTVRDPRGFAVKFYTEDGNYDLVGNNTPIFFIRDPYTNVQESDNAWDFFSHSPEATHQFTWLFGDRGIPASYRHMDGFGSHTFLTSEEAARIAGTDPDYGQRDLMDAIDRKEHPSWTLKMQIMPLADAASYRFNPFDLTKVWPYSDYPLVEVGRIVLDRNPENYFAEVEQSAFNPANYVPGIGPSPDKMLQGRLFACADTQRYRLGINHTMLPVNSPHAANYGRGGPAQTGEPTDKSLEIHGIAGAQGQEKHREDTDFVQAGALYRVMKEDERERLVANLAASFAGVRDQAVQRPAPGAVQ